MILLTGLIPTTNNEYLVSTIHYNPELMTDNPNMIEGLTERGMLGEGVGYLVETLPQIANKPSYDYYLRIKENKPYWVEVVRQINVVSKEEFNELKEQNVLLKEKLEEKDRENKAALFEIYSMLMGGE